MRTANIFSTLLTLVYRHVWKEEFLALQYARIIGRQSPLSETDIPTAPQNWGRLLLALHRGRILSCITAHRGLLTRLIHQGAPDRTKNVLLRDYYSARVYRVNHRNFSKRVIQALHRANIRFVIMKTYAYERRLYPIFGGTIYKDLDILIQPDDFNRASAILFRKGYNYYPTPDQKSGMTKMPGGNFYIPQGEETFKKGPHTIELHEEIIEPPEFYPFAPLTKDSARQLTHELFRHTTMVRFYCVPTPVFTPTALFLSLFLHTVFHHNFQPIRAYVECARIIFVFYEDIDWKYIDRFIQTFKLRSYFHLFISLLLDVFPDIMTHLPNKAIGAIRRQSFSAGLLLLFLHYKLFHPTNFSKKNSREMSLCWGVLENRLFSLASLKIRNFL